MSLTVKALCEALVRHPKITSAQVPGLKRLAEMEGMDAAPTAMDAPPAEGAETGDAISAAFESAIMAIVKEALSKGMDKKGVLKTIGKLLDGHGDAKAGGDTGGEGEEEAAAEEARRKAAADPIGVFAECKTAGYEPTAPELRVLCQLTAEERKAHIAAVSERNKTYQQPSAASRRPGAGSSGKPPLTEQTRTPAPAQKIPKFDEL